MKQPESNVIREFTMQRRFPLIVYGLTTINSRGWTVDYWSSRLSKFMNSNYTRRKYGAYSSRWQETNFNSNTMQIKHMQADRGTINILLLNLNQEINLHIDAAKGTIEWLLLVINKNFWHAIFSILVRGNHQIGDCHQARKLYKMILQPKKSSTVEKNSYKAFSTKSCEPDQAKV